MPRAPGHQFSQYAGIADWAHRAVKDTMLQEAAPKLESAADQSMNGRNRRKSRKDGFCQGATENRHQGWGDKQGGNRSVGWNVCPVGPKKDPRLMLMGSGQMWKVVKTGQ